MKITQELVDHVARLARLDLTGEEAGRMQAQLGDILGYIGLLDELELSDVPPTSHVIEMVNVMRDDEVKPSLPVEKGLANAPAKEGTAFKVPRIIED
ncbi:MAG: Asp-tRNA(Asn)/Glu-tRNA(Gln) amidotransferase subunit GatC [bacterium]|nr:Asp-tRNA(Asn)/Glu-tRNA(Gln) amidotransferase subunit GatC [bacterium]MDT8366286.1 Asp-tRNA(Asn)/Glu-tRNA(Gln) amidotransferase subunit GatC [bacterium]